MELFSNFFQIAVTMLGFCMSGILVSERSKTGIFSSDLLLWLLCPRLSLLDAVSAFVF